MGAATILLGLAVMASGDLEDGIALYQNKDYREALAAFGRAGANKQSAKRRARIHVYIGIIQYRFGQKDDARASFETALDHHPTVVFPDPSQVGARRLFESMQPEEDDGPDEPKKRKKRKKRRKKRRKRRARPDDGPPDRRLASLPSPPPPPPPDVTAPAAPPPPPIVEAPVTPPEEPGPPVAAWATAGGATIAAIVGTVLIVVGRNNGQAALDPSLDALEAESLHDLHRVQVGTGIGALALAGVSAGVASYLFATH